MQGARVEGIKLGMTGVELDGIGWVRPGRGMGEGDAPLRLLV
jgi:hypothetical protein